ncbi:MAG: hypothetical protein QF754_01915 [Alphaproteobacteria bacterium]|jgi:hypothetical protein|nr:hypothetical protein [Alphaproteobacteria bacterium]
MIADVVAREFLQVAIEAANVRDLESQCAAVGHCVLCVHGDVDERILQVHGVNAR